MPDLPASSSRRRRLLPLHHLAQDPGEEPHEQRRLAALARDRKQRSGPLVDQVFAWARSPVARPSSALAGAVTYPIDHEAGLRVFLDDPLVDNDNIRTERGMRGPAVGRRATPRALENPGTVTLPRDLFDERQAASD